MRVAYPSICKVITYFSENHYILHNSGLSYLGMRQSNGLVAFQSRVTYSGRFGAPSRQSKPQAEFGLGFALL